MAEKPTRISQILPQGAAAGLLETVRRQTEWLVRIRRQLPEPLASHCAACALVDSRLVIYADAPPWAFQLRFAGPRLQRELRGLGFTAISAIEVRLLTPAAAPPARPAILPSPQVTDLLRSNAQAPATDPLAASLRRLGDTLQQLQHPVGTADPEDQDDGREPPPLHRQGD